MSAKKTEEGGSFWTTLPGIVTAITGLVTVLGDEGILKRLGISRLGTETPIPFSTLTPEDQDDPLSTPGVVTSTVDPNAPDCTAYLSYEGPIAEYDRVILAWSEEELWVRYSELEEDVFKREDISAKRFPFAYKATDCLAEFVRYLSNGRQVHWPVVESSQGREYSTIWFDNEVTIDLHELESFPVVPDMVLVTVWEADETYMQIYHCGADIPGEILEQVGYWYASTDEGALAEILTRFDHYLQKPSVPCQ